MIADLVLIPAGRIQAFKFIDYIVIKDDMFGRYPLTDSGRLKYMERLGASIYSAIKPPGAPGLTVDSSDVEHRGGMKRFSLIFTDGESKMVVLTAYQKEGFRPGFASAIETMVYEGDMRPHGIDERGMPCQNCNRKLRLASSR